MEKQLLSGNKYYIGLGSEPNIDFLFQGTESSRLLESLKKHDLIYFGVNSIQEAKELQRKYIIEFDLGGGNYVGGNIIDTNGNPIAYISYNGRIWEDRNGWKDGRELDVNLNRIK